MMGNIAWIWQELMTNQKLELKMTVFIWFTSQIYLK